MSSILTRSVARIAQSGRPVEADRLRLLRKETGMADVNVNQQPSSSSSSSTWIVALLVVIVLAIVLWFVLARSGGQDKTDINVDINVPGQTGGGGNTGSTTNR